jgi:hypothetical protein
VRTLVTIGDLRDPSELGPLPPSVRVERWVPQADVMQDAVAMVTHLLAALAASAQTRHCSPGREPADRKRSVRRDPYDPASRDTYPCWIARPSAGVLSVFASQLPAFA